MENYDKNRDRVFNAIQELLDSAYGRYNSYAPYCYSSCEGKSRFDEDKCKDFINTLTTLAAHSPHYSESIHDLIAECIYLTIRFVADICSPSEQSFASIRKICNTISKSPSQKQSTFECLFLIEEEKNNLDSELRTRYKQFVEHIDSSDCEAVIACIKKSVDLFIETNKLNTICENDRITDAVLYRIRRLSNNLQHEYNTCFYEDDANE